MDPVLACLYYIEDHVTFVRLDVCRAQRLSSVCIALNVFSYTFWLTVSRKLNPQILELLWMTMDDERVYVLYLLNHGNQEKATWFCL